MEDCKALKHMLHGFCLNQNITAKINLFSCGEDFLNSITDNLYDIVYMEICSNGINGIDIMHSVKSNTSLNPQIIFSSSTSEYALEAFNLNAAHYLMKPLTKAGMSEAMKRCLSRLKVACSDILRVKTGSGVTSIPTSNIIYIEISNKVCIIQTTKKEIKTYSSLDAMEGMLDEATFIRANRSFIVNMGYIDYFYFDHIVLNNGTTINLSRNNRSQLKDCYIHYLFDMALKGEA
jgi:DNA-binding LytR/AlgR family response regulator